MPSCLTLLDAAEFGIVGSYSSAFVGVIVVGVLMIGWDVEHFIEEGKLPKVYKEPLCLLHGRMKRVSDLLLISWTGQRKFMRL